MTTPKVDLIYRIMYMRGLTILRETQPRVLSAQGSCLTHTHTGHTRHRRGRSHVVQRSSTLTSRDSSPVMFSTRLLLACLLTCTLLRVPCPPHIMPSHTK